MRMIGICFLGSSRSIDIHVVWVLVVVIVVVIVIIVVVQVRKTKASHVLALAVSVAGTAAAKTILSWLDPFPKDHVIDETKIQRQSFLINIVDNSNRNGPVRSE